MAEPFTVLTGAAAPLLIDDIDTDQIAPVSEHSRRLDPDYASLLFARRRRNDDGSEDPAFVLNRPPFRRAAILVTGDHFGCGSARESAVWALLASGIRCIVARGFAELYRENCLRNGILPVVLAHGDRPAFEAGVVAVDGTAPYTVDLPRSHIVAPDGRIFAFSLDPAERHVLLHGTDLVALSLRLGDAIDAWEERTARERPWMQHVSGPMQGE